MSSHERDPHRQPFPIVGIGASAGGVEAFSDLLRHLPANSGMAFVLIQHLDPRHSSLLPDAMRRATSMPVHQIEEGMAVEPDHVYVIPPDSDVGILHGVLTLLPRPPGRQPHLAIDFFFVALAKDQGENAIGVVLSGTGSDGTAGLRAILAEDGITFAQDPSTAQFSGMPEAAINAGVVDVVLPIPELVGELLRVVQHPLTHRRDEVLSQPSDEDGLKKILVVLRNVIGVDFSEYKSTTLKRRLARRMALRRVSNLQEYLRLLRMEPEEVQTLFDDVLIHVTSFFRDGAAFERLKTTVFPEIVKAKPGETIRIWVAGCSTGEEVYSIAMVALEFLESEGGLARTRIQIFATDISEKSIAKARAGVFPEAIATEISEDRLRRFFTKVDGGYQISKPVRELCAFVRHDLGRDPPFSKIDLIACRNVLIYFGQSLQRRVLANFHFALNMPGYLLIGRTESIPEAAALFSAYDKEHKIFTRTAAKSALRLAPAEPRIASPAPARTAALKPELDVVRRFETLLLDHYAPAGVIVDERMEILHFRGRTGPFLEPAPGQPQHNLLHMLREGLLADTRIALAQARRESTTVRKPGVIVHRNGSTMTCTLVVVPLAAPPAARQHLFGVLFEDERGELAETPSAQPAPPAPTDKSLAAELASTKEYLQSVIDDHQRANDELTSANEELTSTNEELQSLNEELEAAKEELQSSNEELTTLNEELETRNAELAMANGDLLNVLGSVEVPIVIVDGSRRIRRFTPKARPILNLLPGDIGRPIGDIRPAITLDLDAEIAQVIETVTMSEIEVRDRDGRWYRLQIRPYTTIDKRIDGAVISFVDIDVLKQAVSQAEWARDYARATVEAIQLPLALLDEHVRIVSVNDAFDSQLGTQADQLVGRSLYEIMDGCWDHPELRALIGQVMERGERFRDHEIEISREGRRQVLALAAQRLPSRGNAPPMILLSVEDITVQRTDAARLVAEANEAKARAEEASRAKDMFLATVSHELRTPLTPLLLNVDILRIPGLEAAARDRALEGIANSARVQAKLIDDLLDLSRIATGKLQLELQPVDLRAVTHAALETVSQMAAQRRISIALEVAPSLPLVKADPTRLQQIVWNLLVNAIKFSHEDARVTVTVDVANDCGRIQVADQGLGIAPAFRAHIFDSFSQADQTNTRKRGGLGLGLALVRRLVDAHHGTVEAASPGLGQGATFTVHIPLWTGKQPSAERPAAKPQIRNTRILLVEDDPRTREALAQMLSAAGADVKAADSAAAAVTLFEQFRPAILVSDIGMPDEDGYSLIRRIRALGPERGGNVPAVALTAFASDDDRRKALEAGFQQHLAKPVDADRLIQAIASLSATR